jgi:hypothetical protein
LIYFLFYSLSYQPRNERGVDEEGEGEECESWERRKVRRIIRKGEGRIGSGGRRIRPIHISHWLRRELPSAVMEDENTCREQGRSLYDIL